MRLTSNVCQRAVEISRLIASTGGKNTGKLSSEASGAVRDFGGAG